MEFNQCCSLPDALNANKRVRFSHGLVLGVGELKTEQNFFLAQHYAHNRRLHGYGTGAGLALDVTYGSDGPECRVSPGWGVDAHGRDICIAEAQCAKLNAWLSQAVQDGELSPPLDPSGTSSVEAFVALCYRECETDKVPIPVGPCLSLDKSMVPSRILQAFELRLLAEAPPQAEEDALRRLGDVFSRISLAEGSGGSTTPSDVLAELAKLLEPAALEPSTPADIVLDPAHAEEIMRAALRYFVTRVRPQLVPDGGPCLGGPRDTACLLLGRLLFDVVRGASGFEVVPGSVVVDEGRRPLLLSTAFLQEALLSTRLPGIAGTSPAAPFPTTSTSVPTAPPSTTTRVLLPPAIASLQAGAVVEAFGVGIPSLRFRRNSAAIFPFGVPAGFADTHAVRLRLQWAIERSGASPDVQVTWEASLRLQGADDDLSAAGAPPPILVNIVEQTPVSAEGRLLTTAFVDLPFTGSPAPSLGFLTLTLRTALALPNSLQIQLLAAELELTEGGQP